VGDRIPWSSARRFYHGGSVTWPSKILVPFAFTVLLSRLILQAIGYTRLIIDPDAEQIAVPVMHEVAEMADKEIHDTFGDEAEDARAKRGE